MLRREARVDLAAIRRNVRRLREIAGTPHAMAVVKADGYGHGSVPVARAALAGGADWLGVVDIAEALRLRDAGIDAPLLCWLHAADADFGAALDASIDVGVSSRKQLNAVAAAARDRGLVAAVHVKVDTGLGRNGVPESEWRGGVGGGAPPPVEGGVRVRGGVGHPPHAGG